MGNDVKTVYKIRIGLEKMSYAPGEVINGAFSFDYQNDIVKRNRIKVNNPAVIISLVQIESIRMRTLPKTTENVVATQALNIKELLEIHKNPDAKIPFQFQIPLNVQPSFEWPKEANVNCSLRSLIKIEIKDIKAEGTGFLMIKKNSTPLNSPLEVIEKSHKKGIFTGGDVLLKANYQTNSFPILSKVPFTFTVDFTQSKYKIKGLS